MIAVYVIIGIVVISIFILIGIYNGLVGFRNQVKNAWAQIDVQLKRRYDLIPNLVETVKGYMEHERETLEAVTNALRRLLSDSTLAKRLGEQGRRRAVENFSWEQVAHKKDLVFREMQKKTA